MKIVDGKAYTVGGIRAPHADPKPRAAWREEILDQCFAGQEIIKEIEAEIAAARIPATTGEGEVERVAKELYADLWNREVAIPPGFEVTPEMAPDFPYLYREPARMGARRAIAAVAALPSREGE